jgi:hypothetical protein
LSSDETILSLVQEIARRLDFGATHPFSHGLFSPVLQWVAEEKDILERIENLNLDVADLRRIWDIVTVDFPNYRKGLKAAYIKMVEETYQRAGIPLPS